MPFQKEHITIDQRMHIVTSIIGQPRQWGLVTKLARASDLSRQSVYNMVERGREALSNSLLPEASGRPTPSLVLSIDKNRIDRGIATLTTAAHASNEGVRICLEEMLEVRRSPGYVSGVLGWAKAGAHSRLESLCPPGAIRADLDEIFTGSTPNLAVIDRDSLLILSLAHCDSRDSTAWGVVLLEQAARGVVVAEAASDGALGIAGGLKEAAVTSVHLGDLFHALRDLMVVAGQLEKAAYAAIANEEQARLVEAEARAKQPRRGPKRRGQLSVALATAASTAAIRRFDDYRWLVSMVSVGVAPVEARSGRLRTAQEAAEALVAVVELLRGMGEARINRAAAKLERSIAGLVAYLKQLAGELAPWLERLGKETVELSGWGWQHRQRLGLTTEAAVEAAFPGAQQAGVRAVWRALDNAHRGSSLVECINSLLRPHLLVHRGADQGLLDLLACYLNHRVFSRGKRQGKSPLQWAGLPEAGDWLVAIGFAPKNHAAETLIPPAKPQSVNKSVNRKAA